MSKAGGLMGWFRKRRPHTIVLGQELADALRAEQARVASEPDLISPMPKDRYPEEDCLASLDPKRIPLDSEIAELCRKTATLDAEANARMRRAISMDEFYTLLAFSRRMALFSIRENSAAALRDGVAALSLIELARVDHRDVSLALGVLSYSGNRIGQDSGAMLRDASLRAEPEIAKLMLAFAGRSFAGKKLSDLSFFEEVSTKEGPAFVLYGFAPYNPTVDLLSLAIEIAEILKADTYFPTGIQIATQLPPVWLRSAGESAVSEALQGTRAGVSVTGFLRSSEHPKEQGHGVLVFLVQVAGAARARALVSVAQSAKHARHSVLGCAEGDLFCLVVGHSIMRDVEPAETASSLARFAPAISGALRRSLPGAPGREFPA